MSILLGRKREIFYFMKDIDSKFVKSRKEVRSRWREYFNYLLNFRKEMEAELRCPERERGVELEEKRSRHC